MDGESSPHVSVDSGVPQGTVLGPLLFLCHINDLPSVVSPHTQVRLFADDCLLYRVIQSAVDQQILQEDLQRLEEWGNRWGMRFHASKCTILRICRSKTPLTKMYTLCGQILTEVDRAKYLGVTISKELSWSPHIDTICNKASGQLSFLRRNLKNCPQHLKEQAYIALVRSVLEYSASIWDPHKLVTSKR